MIEINLARQCQQSAIRGGGLVKRSFVWVCVALCLGIGMASWWWTQSLEQEYANLLQEKHVETQLRVKLQSTVNRLKQSQKDRQLLRDTFEGIHAKEIKKIQPIVLLGGVSHSAGDLEIWLDRVQMIDWVVELRGESYSLKDIESYVDALEQNQVIASLPVVKVLEEKDKKNEKIFSFIIRFTLENRVAI